ncbi:hypothetical protein [Streptomyces prunicolor]
MRKAGPSLHVRRNSAERAERAALVFDLTLQGLSTYKIDALTRDPNGPTGGHRISATSVKEMLSEEIARRVDPKAEEYRKVQLARLEAALERLHNMEGSVRTVMARKHITVNNGRVIRILDENSGEEEPVEDDTFVLQAVDRLNRIEEQRRKTSDSICRLLGLDMPVKVDATVHEVKPEDIELAELIREAQAKNAVEEARIKGGNASE